MLGGPNEAMILRRPFLATIHARINVVRREILLGIKEDRIMFDINGNVHHLTIHVDKVYMANFVQEEESFNPLEISNDLFLYDPPLENLEDEKGRQRWLNPGTAALRLHSTFEVKRYSFENGKSFVYVTKMLDDDLPLGWVTGQGSRKIIQKEIDTTGSVQKET
ncbi:hypothetical protein Tco_0002081 [Tanacetum coccineum]